MARVVHFEIHADEPERAVRFYTELFGWQCERWGGPMDYWMVKTGEPGTPGIDGGILKRVGIPAVEGQAVNSYVCTIDVEDIDAMMAKVRGQGGPIVVEKMPVPGIGWLAYAKDSEGNIFGMMQNDPSAG